MQVVSMKVAIRVNSWKFVYSSFCLPPVEAVNIKVKIGNHHIEPMNKPDAAYLSIVVNATHERSGNRAGESRAKQDTYG